MKAIRIEQFGSHDVLRLCDVPHSKPSKGQILVRNEAIGVNFADVYNRTGLYPIALPSGIGSEGAGIVEEIGIDVSRFRRGDRVGYCLGPVGAYSELHAVEADRAVHIPGHVHFETVAASLLKGLTAHYLLRKTARIQSSDQIVVHAAAGGVGQILVRWAKHLGATVIATVGSEGKQATAKAAGADHVLVASGDNIATRVRELTNGRGADVVYDGVGKDTWEASLDCLRPLGMMVSFGNASGVVPAVNPLVLTQKGSLFLTRPTLRHYVSDAKSLDEASAELFELIRKGKPALMPPTRYPLAEASQAHHELEGRQTSGSIVLVP
jgi:NADPH:quinone reductase